VSIAGSHAAAVRFHGAWPAVMPGLEPTSLTA
jgi:hypothetical protein